MPYEVHTYEARSLVLRGLSPLEAAALAGCDPSEAESDGRDIGWLPLPHEITERAAQVRARWSKAETLRRQAEPRPERWSAPEYRDSLP